MDIDAGATTRLIDRLAAKGLVERERSAADRRVVMLRLTAAGEAVSACVPQVLAEVNNAYLRGFSRDEWQLLKQLLRRMLDNGQALGGTASAAAPAAVPTALPAALPAAVSAARRGRR
jgi:DNA-binding MarR family transcriptional regulator